MPIVKGLEWTFNTRAELYDRMRPGYPKELYQDLFAYKPVDAASRAVEVGIGTGQATRPVLETGCRVTAVEYGAELASICREKFRDFPNFSAVTGKFEDAALEEGAYDLVYSASAFHWIPEEIGYPKVYGMLKPGGAFARFANHPNRDPNRPEMHEALQAVYAVYMPGTRNDKIYGEEEARERAEVAARYGFVDVRYKLYHRVRTLTAEEYVQLVSTYSDHVALEEEKRECFFAEIRQVIGRLGGEISIYDTLDLQLARRP